MCDIRFFILISLSIVIYQNPAQAKNLTWHEAVQMAQNNNSDLISSQKTFLSTKTIQNTSFSGFLPKLSASLNETDSKSQGFDSTKAYGAQLNLSQNIFNGFFDLNRSRMLEANSNAASAQLKSSLSVISSDLRNAFEAVLFLKSFKKLTADIILRRKENLKNVQLQFQSGRENKGSVLLSESYVEQALLDDLMASHQVEITVENLKRILGLTTEDDIEISDQDQNLFLADLQQIKIEFPNFHQLALSHPDVLSIQAQTEANLYSYQMSQAAFYPQLDLSGTYGNYDDHFFPEKNRWSVNLTLSIPLFDGTKDYYSVKSNYLKYESSRLQTENKLKLLQIQIKQAYQNYLEAVQKEKVDLSFNKAAEVRAQIGRSKYKNGLLSFDDWDLIETDLIKNQKSYLNSVKELVAQFSNWEQAQGVGVLSEKK